MGKNILDKEKIWALFAVGKEISKKFMVFVKRPPCNKEIEPRDASPIIQVYRDFLLGRKYVKHNRYEPFCSPRSIPPADIPIRGDDPKYFNNYYFNRHALNSIKPPVIVDTGRVKLTQAPAKQSECCTSCVPTPGYTWWWDGHCYYEDSCNRPAK